MAWVLRFTDRCRKDDKYKVSRCLCAEELRIAETSMCRLSQEEGFALEINILKYGGSLKKRKTKRTRKTCYFRFCIILMKIIYFE